MVNSGSGAVKSAVDASSRHTLQLHSTPQGWGTKLVSWLDAAWVRGDKVVVEHAPGAAPDVRRGMVRAGLDVARPGRRRVERVWSDGRVVMVRVDNPGTGGSIATAGFRSPRRADRSGAGMWLARQLADVVHVGQGPAGIGVELRFPFGN